MLRLGLVFDDMDRHGVAEIVGVSADMRRAFSRRRTEIVAEMNRLGVHSGEGARIAALRTRRPKLAGVTEDELRAEWRQRASDHRFDLSNAPRVARTPVLRAADSELSAMNSTNGPERAPMSVGQIGARQRPCRSCHRAPCADYKSAMLFSFTARYRPPGCELLTS